MPLDGLAEAQAYVLLAIVGTIGSIVAANLQELVPDADAEGGIAANGRVTPRRRRERLIWFCVTGFLIVWAYLPWAIAYNEFDWSVFAGKRWLDLSLRDLYDIVGLDVRYVWHLAGLLIVLIGFIRLFFLLRERERRG